MGIMDKVFLKVIKALYIFKTSGNRWHTVFLHTLRGMGFISTFFDPNVWIKGREGGYDYIVTHTDDFLSVTIDPTSIFEELKETYIIKIFGAPEVHLGCDYTEVNVGNTTQWVMGYLAYTTKAFWKVCAFYKVTNLRKDRLPSCPGEHPYILLGDNNTFPLYSGVLQITKYLYQPPISLGASEKRFKEVTV